MRLLRHLQHWLGGSGPALRVADVVPTTHSIRQWSDTFPWAAMVEAIEQSVVNADAKKLEFNAHSLKSMSSSLGVTRLAELAASLEIHGRESEFTLASRGCTELREIVPDVLEALRGVLAEYEEERVPAERAGTLTATSR